MTKLRLACLASIFALAIFPAAPQLLAPGSRLFLVETSSFSIYYPESLEAEARRLAGFADEVLDQEIGRVGPRPTHRLTVLLADRFAEQNGYYTSYPSDRIVLEIAPGLIDDEMASSADPLRGIFAHELAHDLSLSTRGPLFKVGAALFGDPVAPAFWLGPRLLAEGTAIAAESGAPGEGHGRTADPLSMAPLVQDLVENRRPDFWQATGAYGIWPFGESPYSFGGPFAAWLERRYGDEALAKIWREIAAIRPPEDPLFVKGAFTKAFGGDLDRLWKEYLDEMTPKRPLVVATRFLPGTRSGSIVASTAGKSGGKGVTFWADASEGSVFEWADGDRRPRRLFEADSTIDRLDLSADGRYLLVSAVVEGPDGVGLDMVLVRDLAKNVFTKRRIVGVREAAWDGDAGPDGSGDIVGIAARGIETDLVRVRDGKLDVLLRGGPTRLYGSPVALDGDAVAFIARDAGRALLVKLDEGLAQVLVSSVPLDGLRFLSGGGERLAAAYADPGDLYRLVLVDAAATNAPLVSIQEVELSGGMEYPAFRSSPEQPPALSYIASMADGQRPADFPFDIPAVAPHDSAASWVALDPSFSSLARDASQGADTRAPLGKPAPPLPLALSIFRAPYVSSSLDAAGLFVEGTDLTDTLDWTAEAGWNWGASASDFGATAALNLGPWVLGAQASDRFVQGNGAGIWWRSSNVNFSLSRFFASFPSNRGLQVGAQLAGGAAATVPPGSPWSGSLSSTGLAARSSLDWTDTSESAFPPFDQRGYDAGAAADVETRSGSGTVVSASADADFWIPVAGIHARLDAEASPFGLTVGPGGRFFADGSPSILAATAADWPIFSGLGLAGPWYSRVELSARLFDIEIGSTVRPLFIEARRLFATAGLRYGAIGGNFGQPGADEYAGISLLSSYFADISFEFSPLVGIFSSEGLAAGVELEWTPLAIAGGQSWQLGFLVGSGH